MFSHVTECFKSIVSRSSRVVTLSIVITYSTVLRNGRARDHASFQTVLHAAEYNKDNEIFKVEYTARCLRVILLAHCDEHDNVEHTKKIYVHKLF